MRIKVPVAALLVPVFLLIEVGVSPAQSPSPAPLTDLTTTLEPWRASGNLPALAAAIIIDGHLVAIGAVGVRQLGLPAPVTVHDRFHLGSDTKAMTATLAAMLVEEGHLKWQTTVGEVFPEEKKLDPACRVITLEELLTHRAGLPHDPHSEQPYLEADWQERTSPIEQRLYLLREVLSQAPEAPPGKQYSYSNVGYAVAGAMLEKIMGTPWEELMQKRVFKPLGMASAGFGSPGRLGETVGHKVNLRGDLAAMPPGPGDDNPAAIGPAGTVHCNLEDWAKFALLHLQGSHGDTPLLKKAGFEKLHSPPSGQDYAMGWTVVSPSWAGGIMLKHDGSNETSFAMARLVPGKNCAVLVATNCFSDRAPETCANVVATLLKKYGILPAAPSK